MSLSAKQSAFLTHVEKGENVFLTGKAGTGKSYVVKLAIERLKKLGKNVIALAPTGIAANNIGGQTIHSMFSLQPFGVLDYSTCNFLKSEKRRMLNKVDAIVIDEVSMLRPDILDAINWTLLKNGCRSLLSIQIILVGDLKQLPSPIDDNMRSVMMREYLGTEFHNAKIYDDLNLNYIELDEILRQSNPDFITALNVIREGGKHPYFRQFVGKKGKGIILAPHNSTVAQYNIDGLNSVMGLEYVFDAVVTGNVKAGDFNLETRVVVKDGCKVMHLANSKNNDLINGTLGTFKVIDGCYFIRVGSVDHALEAVTFTKKEYVLSDDKKSLELQELGSITQLPIKLAYALTIHKSQGLTFDEITLDLTLPCFSPGQMYVALSRVTGPDGLTIITR